MPMCTLTCIQTENKNGTESTTLCKHANAAHAEQTCCFVGSHESDSALSQRGHACAVTGRIEMRTLPTKTKACTWTPATLGTFICFEDRVLILTLGDSSQTHNTYVHEVYA
eukprot:m.25402 g.25402  ORF g.25402 m.25402 type:complete len:111 (-) comp8704_c0_seq1:428-760(-)